MSLFTSRDGYYDEEGWWQRTKFCFVSCGARCTCMPPAGYYNAAYDKRREIETDVEQVAVLGEN